MVTTSKGNSGLWATGVFSRLVVSARVPSMNTVETPAPTEASVNATSTASRITNRLADTRL